MVQQQREIDRLTSDAISRWRGGETPNTRKFLDHNPELLQCKTAVLDLAYEEYCLRRDAGDRLTPSTYCESFPGYRKSLMRLLEVHEYAESNSGFPLGDKPVQWPIAGDVFAGFELLEELGRGAFARVFRASETALGKRAVALKISRLGFKEADTLGKLSHTNIVSVHSVRSDTASGLTAICMPYLGRSTLCDVLDAGFADGHPPERASIILQAVAENDIDANDTRPVAKSYRGTYVSGVVHIGRQIAEALAYTHAKGILHRDLKPSNVLLTSAGEPKLLDFNLSADNGKGADRVGGTLPYMPPEQIAAVFDMQDRKGESLSPKSDLFSLGAVLYEMLGGRLPFGDLPPDKSPEDAAREVLSRQSAGPISLCRTNPCVDIGLWKIVADCLRGDPMKRPASATVLAQTLDTWLSDRQRITRWARLHRRRLVASAVVALGATCWGGWFLASRPPYQLRQLEQGVAIYEAGDYKTALEYFDRAKGAGLDSAEVHFARGQALRLMGDYQAADEAYMSACKRSSDGLIRECLGYCFSSRGYNEDAVLWYDQAVDVGYTSAALWNNLGYSQLRIGRYPPAQSALDQAKRLDDSLQAAFHNAACLAIRRAERGDRSSLQQGIADIERAITLGPATAQHYYDAALLHALASEDATDHTAKVFDNLRSAIALGHPTAGLASDKGPFGRFLSKPLFADVLREPLRRKRLAAKRLAPPPSSLSLH